MRIDQVPNVVRWATFYDIAVALLAIALLALAVRMHDRWLGKSSKVALPARTDDVGGMSLIDSAFADR